MCLILGGIAQRSRGRQAVEAVSSIPGNGTYRDSGLWPRGNTYNQIETTSAKRHKCHESYKERMRGGGREEATCVWLQLDLVAVLINE